MFKIPRDTPMTTELLAKYITKHKAEVSRRFKILQDAYLNDYEIKHYKPKPSYKPDNRVPVNFAKYITDTMNGFFIGVPIKVTSDNEKVNEYVELLDRYNGLDDGNSELSKISSIFGRGYEMYYVDEDSNIGITHLSPMEAFFIYDESILARPLYFIRYYKDENNQEHGSWSDASVVQHFDLSGSYKFTDEPTPHGFDDVPATEYKENAECVGIFESVLPLINAYNKALSEKANDVDYFADAYLKVIGTLLERDDVKQIRDDRIINFDGVDSNVDVGFLAKPDGDASQEHLIDRLERLIFETSMVANISDENFGTASGIALRYKLLAMSNLAITKERKFKAGMERRYKVIFSNPLVTVGSGISADDWTSINYQFTRNYPANVSDEATTAKYLEGVVSKETQLGVLSIVDNPKTEIERMEEEQQETIEAQAQMQKLFGAAEDEQ